MIPYPKSCLYPKSFHWNIAEAFLNVSFQKKRNEISNNFFQFFSQSEKSQMKMTPYLWKILVFTQKNFNIESYNLDTYFIVINRVMADVTEVYSAIGLRVNAAIWRKNFWPYVAKLPPRCTYLPYLDGCVSPNRQTDTQNTINFLSNNTIKTMKFMMRGRVHGCG